MPCAPGVELIAHAVGWNANPAPGRAEKTNIMVGETAADDGMLEAHRMPQRAVDRAWPQQHVVEDPYLPLRKDGLHQLRTEGEEPHVQVTEDQRIVGRD